MKISVIIPVYNAQRTLPVCCKALLQQTYFDYEVVFVDNNSTDASCTIITLFINEHRQFNARLLKEKKQGACAARNRGAREAAGDIITHTDPDCLPDSDWLRDIAEAFKDDSIAACAGRIAGRQPENDYELFSALFTLKQGSREAYFHDYTLVEGGYATANLSFRKTVFNSLGGFDETINYKGTGIGEDHDLLARMYKNGGILKVVKNATVFHWHRSDIRGVFRQGYLFGLAHALLLKRHGRDSVMVTLGDKNYFLPLAVKGWIDLNGIDKKVAVLLLPGVLNPLLFLMAAAYLFLQYLKIKKRLDRQGYSRTNRSALMCLNLLFIKCGAMTAGSVHGSFMQRVICL
ncbi:MAG: glycosyltransferase [Chitinispirillaceae bacterium]|nr:glycosyltransferase [Chitinispirillaceae bacterium]